jgi:hypothetical protein
MMAKKYQHQRNMGLEISLFPFLSIFLCVMGVLSFLNLLNSALMPRKLVMTVEVAQGYKVAYQIFCQPDGFIAVPPIKRLAALNSGNETIQAILQKRRQQQGLSLLIPTETNITNIFQEIQWLNDYARQNDFLYEEFVLFGIYPDSGEIYHTIRRILDKHPELLGISMGLEALDSNWKLTNRLEKAVP